MKTFSVTDRKAQVVWPYGPNSLNSLYMTVDERAPDDYPSKAAAVKYNKEVNEGLMACAESIALDIDAEIVRELLEEHENKC